MTLVDSNVVIYALTPTSPYYADALSRMDYLAKQGPLAINPTVYAEVAGPYPDEAALDAALAPLNLVRLDLPFAAGFAASKAFDRFRRNNPARPRTAILSDFYIGAHAQVAGLKLFSADTRNFHTYFPGVDLIRL